ncbi:peptidyl-prolyl cis-trans isomerase pasticcino1 isoform X1, partial [Tanacetum coccineum]
MWPRWTTNGINVILILFWVLGSGASTSDLFPKSAFWVDAFDSFFCDSSFLIDFLAAGITVLVSVDGVVEVVGLRACGMGCSAGKGTPIRQVMGKSKMILGLIEGIPTMLKGEVAVLKMKPELHYGEDECPVSAPDSFPKDAELNFEIE